MLTMPDVTKISSDVNYKHFSSSIESSNLLVEIPLKKVNKDVWVKKISLNPKIEICFYHIFFNVWLE